VLQCGGILPEELYHEIDTPVPPVIGKEDFSQIKLLSETEKPESDAFSSQKSDPNRSVVSEVVVRVVRSGVRVVAAAPTEQCKIELADESDQLFCRSDMRALTTRVIFPESLIIVPPATCDFGPIHTLSDEAAVNEDFVRSSVSHNAIYSLQPD